MNVHHRFHGIISLSTASIALSQCLPAKGQAADQAIADSKEALNPEKGSKTANLVLAPAHHEELNRLYADHTSHASHSSHSSHASHYSGADSGSYYPAPVTATPVQQQPVSVVPRTNAVNHAAEPAAATGQTNALEATNTVAEPAVTTNTALVDFLKKRAAEGSADAQYSLAISYLNGSDGLQKDTNRAELLLEMSAGQGSREAKEKLGELRQAPADSAKDSK